MMWRFSFASTSTLDSLLSRETPPSVEELMDDTDILQECKSHNGKLVSFLGRDESIKSLLHWVVSGIYELDEQSRQAERRCLAQARGDQKLYPDFESPTSSSSDNETQAVPLEPAKMADQGTLGKEEETDLSAGNMVMLDSTAPAETEEDEVHRARYHTVAAEILTSEVWVIPETIMANKETLLLPFWDIVIPPLPAGSEDGPEDTPRSLYEMSEAYRARVEYGTDEDDEVDRKRENIRGLWVKVNGNLIAKRTRDMIDFIRTIPNVIPRLIAQLHSPAIQDILIRLISAEEAGVPGVIQWLAEEQLVTRLINFLSPRHPPHVHVLATELLKNVITLCAPPPFNPLGGNIQEQQSAQGATSGMRDNRMVRELVSEKSIRKLVGYMLDPIELSDSNWSGLNEDGLPHPADPFIVHPLPSIASAASSLSNISTIFVELIRRNNSDFAEPHLFHTLRNRLINMRMEQGAPLGQMEEGDKEDQDRERMEAAVKGMSEAMGIVHLKSLLDILCERFDRLNQLLREPRTQKHSASTAVPRPLTLERFRIVELYAELLHSSNMSILNRAEGTGPEYSQNGILSGGLAGLELLADAIEDNRDTPGDSVPDEQVTQARELPVSSNASTSASLSGDEVGSDSEDEKMLEDIEEEITPSGSPIGSGESFHTAAGTESGEGERQPPPPSQADAARLREVMSMEPTSGGTSDIGGASHAAVATTTVAPSIASFDDPIDSSEPKATDLTDSSSSPVGERLKQVYLEYRIIPSLIDMFFEHAAHDFLHHVVYDMLQQILNGKLSPGPNRDLVEEMLCESRLVERVLEAQRRNNRAVAGGKNARLPYMGHIILIAEEVVKFLARSPPDLLEKVMPFVPQPEWDAFVAGQLEETRARDAQPLAGGKPSMGTMAPGDGNTSKSEEEESSSDSDDDDNGQLGGFGTFGEPLQRTKAADGYAPRASGGSGSEEENDGTGSEDESAERYWRNTAGLRRQADSSDDDDDDGEWLRPSNDFGTSNQAQNHNDDFDDDDTWGSFSSVSVNADGAENPFGDDNFVPSAPPPPGATSGAPLTPADWFDREFSSAWNDEDEAVPAIVVPGEEEADDGDAEPELPRTPGSTWSFSGEEGEGEELPNTTSPVLEQGESEDLSSDVDKLAISDRTPSTSAIPIPGSSQAIGGGSSSSEAISTSPTTPLPDRSPQAAPIPIPSSPKPRRSSKPPPPPPSPRKRRTSSQSTEKPSPSSITESGISPPDPSLVSATTREEPLGPGVGADVEVTDDGMLRREVDGKEIVVPKDEVALGVEEAVSDRKKEDEADKTAR